MTSTFKRHPILFEVLLLYMAFYVPENDLNPVTDWNANISIAMLENANWGLLPTKDLPVFLQLLRVQPRALCKGLETLLRDPTNFETILFFMGGCQRYPDLFENLHDISLADKIGSLMWKGYSDRKPEKRNDIVNLLLAIICQLVDVHGSIGQKVMTRYLLDYDFLSLVEKVVAILTENPKGDISDALMQKELGYTRHVLLNSPEALKFCLRRDFLYITDYYRPLTARSQHGKARMALKWWQELAAVVNITEAGLRKELEADRKQVTGGAVGCSWFKCVRFEQECDPSLLFQCSGCQRSIYCGRLCQTRDWEEGGHKGKCRKSER